MHLRLHPQHAHAPHAHHMPMNMPSTACARHGALYVMVDTWAKVDAHALVLALTLTLTLTLTPNAKHYPVGLHQWQHVALRVRRRLRPGAARQHGHTRRPGSGSWPPPGSSRPLARTLRPCPLGCGAEPRPPGPPRCTAVEPSRRRRPRDRFRCPFTTRYDLGQAKQRMTRHADFRGRYRFVQVRKAVCRGRRSVMKSLLSSPLAWHV